MINARATSCELIATWQDAAASFALIGELDLNTAHDVRQEVIRSLARGPQTVTLDVSALRFVDSTGIHALLQIESACNAAGARLLLDGPSSQLRRVLATFGLSGHFQLAAEPSRGVHLPVQP